MCVVQHPCSYRLVPYVRQQETKRPVDLRIDLTTMSESSDDDWPVVGDALTMRILEQTQGAPPPQRKVDEFWRKFTARTPGKGRHPAGSPAPSTYTRSTYPQH